MWSLRLKTRRCVVPASGFYEWTGAKGSKTPRYFSVPSGKPLAFAALWETWRDPESEAKVDSATIIVGAANDWMARFHHRMPVILDWRDAGAWMARDDGLLWRAVALRAARGCVAGWIVSSRVNRLGVGDDDPALIEPQQLGAADLPSAENRMRQQNMFLFDFKWGMRRDRIDAKSVLSV